MRYHFGISLLAVVLAGCASTPLNDGDQYFDRITPDPAALERTAEENRLKQAENQTQTVRPPTDATVDTAQVDNAQVDVVKAKPKKTKSTTEGDGLISDSQDFGAVKSRETIASDAAKLDELKSNYEIVQPGATPRRGTGINLAKYALAQSNPVGNKIYKRLPLGGIRGKKRCASYISADEAQLAFLRGGGPQRDARGVDPDGDGYACDWSPAVYRSLIGQ